MELLEAVAHLLGHKRTNRAHPSVGLEGRAAHIQGNVGRIDHAPEGQEVARHHLFDGVADEYLVAIQADFPFLPIGPSSQFGEVKDPLEVVGVVGVEVDP